MEVKFVYENQINQTFKCNPQMTMKEICLEFCSRNEINFNSVKFILNEKSLDNSDFEKPINTFEEKINIIVNDYPISGEREIFNLNQKDSIYFQFESNSTKIQFSIKDKMSTICRFFAYKIGLEFDSLNFKYNNKILDFNKNFSEIATQIDLNKREMIINVENKSNLINSYKNKNKHNISNTRTNDIDSKNNLKTIEIQNNELNNKNNNYIGAVNNNAETSNDSFCNRNIKSVLISIIIICILILIFLIILFTVILKREENIIQYNIYNIDKEDEIETNKIGNTDKTYKVISTDNLDSTDELDGMELEYIFSVTYEVENKNEKIKLFNPSKKNNIYAMKIRDKMKMEKPNSEYIFENADFYIVDYYILQNNNIAFSNMFENIDKLVSFSF